MPKARPYQPSSNNLVYAYLARYWNKQGVAMACGLSLLDTNPSFFQLQYAYIPIK